MTPYFNNISDIVPFDVDDLISNIDDLPLDFNVDTKNYVRKNVFGPEILNPKFVQWLKNSVDLTVQKVVLWHWHTDDDPTTAHIDSDPNGNISPGAALNWTISKDVTSVSWYDVKDVDYKVSFNNEGDKRWSTPNVEAYIAVKVNYKDRVTEWSDRGPAILDTTVPHMIYAPTHTRISISLNFGEYNDYQDIANRFEKLRGNNVS